MKFVCGSLRCPNSYVRFDSVDFYESFSSQNEGVDSDCNVRKDYLKRFETRLYGRIPRKLRDNWFISFSLSHLI